MGNVRISINPLTSIGEAVIPAEARAKQERLAARLQKAESLIVAVSGGTDSAYLAWAAHRVLGRRTLAVTALSASYSTYDREQVDAFVAHAKLRHEFIETKEFDNPLYVANNADRCYHCKDELFRALEQLAATRGIATVAYGVNADDTRDFRPGHRAAAEHRVLAPLLDAALNKAEIRWLAHEAGLSIWDRPASACLSSRIPYGTPVTRPALEQVEQGEAVLRELGFRQFRVRFYGELARIEIAREELARAKAMDLVATVAPRFRQIGFGEVALDPEGYRQGSLNAALKKS